MSPLSLELIVEKTLNILNEEIKEKKAKVIIERPLPEVIAHSTTLEQVVKNLLTNALKFIAPGERPWIKIWAEECNGSVRLWVEDKGIGIAKEHHKRIFQVFERLHGTESYPGTGIGLAIVKKGIEKMKGKVGVISSIGKGSKFWIEVKKYEKHN